MKHPLRCFFIEKRHKLEIGIFLSCIFILFLSVFITVAYSRQSNHRPSDIAINNAIYWAQSFLGRYSFPIVGANGSCRSLYYCADFVANAYGYPGSEFNAELLWDLTVYQHSGDWNAPRGSLVFFSSSKYNDALGHVAMCTGNGNVIEAGYEIIITRTISTESISAPYLGWAWPPSRWPGRSDCFKGTAYTLAIQTGKAVIFTIMTWAILLIIKIIIAKKSRAANNAPS